MPGKWQNFVEWVIEFIDDNVRGTFQGKNDLVAPIHDRMPSILPADRWAAWLDPDEGNVDRLRAMLDVFPAEAMAEHPVSTLVNSVKNDSADLTTRLETPAVDAP